MCLADGLSKRLNKNMAARAKDILRGLKVKPSKEKGQNFLIDPGVIDEVISFGRPRKGEAIVEIGPGLGALTSELSGVSTLTVIEIEGEFCRELSQKYPEIKVIHSDVRSVDFSSLGEDLVVFGNLPYSFSTDIVFHLIEHRSCISRAVLMLQKEFAERMGASPGGRDFGVLSISCQLWTDVHFGPVISGKSFHPPAKVDSQLVELVFLKESRFPVSDMVTFKKVVAAAFFKRRKKIVNSLVASRAYDRELIHEALGKAGIDPGRRAESLSIEEFFTLAEEF